MDLSAMASAVAAVNSAIDIGKNALAVRDTAKTDEVVLSMNKKLLDAQQHLFELSASLLSLQQEHFKTTQELRKVREALEDRGRYTLVAISEGQFAYRMNPAPTLGGTCDPGTSKAEHYICQKCFDGPRKVKMALQLNPAATGTNAFWECPGCALRLTLFNTALAFEQPNVIRGKGRHSSRMP